MHDTPWKKVLVVNILTMIVGFQGPVIKTPLTIYIQYADIRKNNSLLWNIIYIYI